MKIFIFSTFLLLFFSLGLHASPGNTFERKSDSIQKLINVAKEDSNKFNLLRLLAYVPGISPSKVMDLGNEMLKLSLKLDLKKGTGIAYYTIGESYLQQGQFENAKIRYFKSDSIADACNSGKQRSLSLIRIAWCYYSVADFKQANLYAEKSLAIAQKIKNKEMIANSSSILGNICLNESKFSEAIDYYLRSLEEYEKLKNLNGQGVCLMSIGNVYYFTEQKTKALKYYFSSLKSFEQIPDSANIANDYDNIGGVYNIYPDSLEKAKKYYNLALNISIRRGDEAGVLKRLNALALVMNAQRDFSKALEYDRKALSMAKKLGIPEGINASYSQIAEVLANMQNYTPALKYTDSSIALSYQTKDVLIRYAGLHLKSIIYELLHQPEKALEYYKKYTDTKDSITSEQKKVEIAQKEMQFGFDTVQASQRAIQSKKDALAEVELRNSKAQRNIFIVGGMLIAIVAIFLFTTLRKVNKLNKKITEEKEKSEQLGKVKDKLFSIISHDLRSPLASLDATTRLLKGGKLPQERMDQLLDNLTLSLGSTITLMDTLLMWSLDQMRSMKLKPVETLLSEITEENLALFRDTANNKHLVITNSIEQNMSIIADKHLMQIVARNLISNAIKFSYNGGEVFISAKENKDYVSYSVADLGMGISREYIEDILSENSQVSSRVGTKGESGNGIGLSLCNELVKKSGGYITIDSGDGQGTSVTVHIPRHVSV